jgi:5'-nucleotidase
MRFSINAALVASLSLACSTDALKILMGNDDGFGEGNLRELYKLMVDAGHEGNLSAHTTHEAGY